jgi:hypothetical protein
MAQNVITAQYSVAHKSQLFCFECELLDRTNLKIKAKSTIRMIFHSFITHILDQ